mgnify:CR=1 FL=1|tara:strand:- start:1095 stop:1895 length:801 start_codon:yes stop_codon:yes gene_type:complete
MSNYPRVIPILLLKEDGLYKTHKYKNPIYIGDPINTIKIFNDKECDELIIIDIQASKSKKPPNFKLLEDLSSECFMPITYGGGIKSLNDIKSIFKLGIEKIALNSVLLENSSIISEAKDIFGSQSIIGVIDINKTLLGNHCLYDYQLGKNIKKNIIDYAKNLEDKGVGELLINFVYLENSRKGYDIEFLRNFLPHFQIPIIANGGIASLNDIKEGLDIGINAAAAGSFFIFKKNNNGILISYPSYEMIKEQILNIKTNNEYNISTM